MGYLMTAEELVRRAKEIAAIDNTIYCYAMYGFQVTDASIAGKAGQGGSIGAWYTSARVEKIKKKMKELNAQGKVLWGFDCVNLFKALFWGWTGDTSKSKGGAVYGSNGVPDTNANGMFNRCLGKSANFAGIEPGEVVWLSGHFGIYIGGGLCVECTPKWDNDVQITALGNLGAVKGYNTRTWTKHGKLPFVDYSTGGGIVAPVETPIAEGACPYTQPGDREIIKLGSALKEKVKWVQWHLNQLGYDLGDAGIDGDFGSMTDKAVRAFQAKAGVVVDGEGGPITKAALKGAWEASDASADDVDEVAGKRVDVTRAGTWNIRRGPGTEYGIIRTAAQGESFPHVLTAENGWHEIQLTGETGWISPVCTKING